MNKEAASEVLQVVWPIPMLLPTGVTEAAVMKHREKKVSYDYHAKIKLEGDCNPIELFATFFGNPSTAN